MLKEKLELLKDKDVKKKMLKMYADIEHTMLSRPSSIRFHHIESGGMMRHIHEVMEIALEIYELSPQRYDCTEDEVILAVFIHDLNKLDSYIECKDEWKRKKGQKFDYNNENVRMNQTARVVQICAQYGILLNDKIVNAVTFHHGGFSPDLSSVYPAMQSMHMTPLAVLLHCADLISSHILGKHQ
jgi:hypothetical protein